jgi:nucleotide-binding universal stress UspA family protein
MSNEHTGTSDDQSGAPVLTSGPIVVGVDGSPNAHRALDVARSLADATGVDVLAVHALGLMSELDGAHVPSSEHRGDIEQRLRDQWCQPLAALGDGRWSCRLVDGSPSDALLHTADDVDASFIVVGARGLGGHPDLMLGSTSHQVIHRSHCTTVVVPPADRPPMSPAVEPAARESI